jgi:D-alanyl-D-alanine dipeptidase
MLLRDAMVSAGFADYPFEWWHYSYGTQDWAKQKNEPHAIYGKAEK